MMHDILGDARQLWELCFPTDEPSFLDFYFKQVAQEQDTYIDYTPQGEAIAHIGILRYAHGIYPDMKLAYISGACTHPKYRKQGLMGRLMQRVITEEKALGTDALILIPADEELRKYYARHFGFRDTAPKLSLAWDSYLGLIADGIALSNVPALSPAHLLQNSVRGSNHIAYTLSEAEAIIEEYRSSGAYVLEYYEGGLCQALILARPSEEVIYIDALITSNRHNIDILHKQLPTDKCHIRNYLFPIDTLLSNIHTHSEIECQPWGMALPLSEPSYHCDWSKLGISLVHN